MAVPYDGEPRLPLERQPLIDPDGPEPVFEYCPSEADSAIPMAVTKVIVLDLFGTIFVSLGPD